LSTTTVCMDTSSPPRRETRFCATWHPVSVVHMTAYLCTSRKLSRNRGVFACGDAQGVKRAGRMRSLRNVNWDESLRRRCVAAELRLARGYLVSVVERDNFGLQWLAAYSDAPERVRAKSHLPTVCSPASPACCDPASPIHITLHRTGCKGLSSRMISTS
jgi:hypothetical protein